ncbi:sugar phosphate isomerase/epimerase family protein [Kineococcus sp. SYSU DK003]|uniref:sugar phosphate isomerase/epimerase family protein n=1 Tax=Kineococcus sp. SYSU DK003 TaxID=3383124 RepID=UPI003D7C4C19
MSTNITNRELLATCWTWAGDARPSRGDERSPHDIRERLAAVSDAGWEGIGLHHADLFSLGDSMGYPALNEMIKEYGISRVEVEFLSNWWTHGALRDASDEVRRRLFEAAPQLGVTTIKVGAELQSFGVEQPVTLERFAQAFDALATDAGDHGVRVAMEPMPMSNVPTLQAGVELVREVGNVHGGLVVDTWHVARGGTKMDELTALLPLEHVFVVELDDADAEVVGSLWDDTCDRRRRPGDGDLDVAGFVAALHQVGWRGHWGVEIISEEQRTTPLREAVQVTRDKTLAVIDAAEALLP